MFDQRLAQFRLSRAQARPLVLIWEHAGLRQGELASRLDIEGPTLVPLLAQLEAMALVVRHADPDDQRAKTLHLTPAGMALVERLMPELDEIRARLLVEVTDEELEVVGRVFEKLFAGLAAERVGAVA